MFSNCGNHRSFYSKIVCFYRNIDYTYRNFSFSGSAAIGTPMNKITTLVLGLLAQRGGRYDIDREVIVIDGQGSVSVKSKKDQRCIA